MGAATVATERTRGSSKGDSEIKPRRSLMALFLRKKKASQDTSQRGEGYDSEADVEGS